MGFLIKVLVTALAVWVADYLLSGVQLSPDARTLIIVAVVLSLLNTVVKPILIVLTIPVTLATLGLFLLVINALMVIWASKLVGGFKVDDWWSALLFSLIVSFVSSVLHGVADRRDKRQVED